MLDRNALELLLHRMQNIARDVDPDMARALVAEPRQHPDDPFLFEYLDRFAKALTKLIADPDEPDQLHNTLTIADQAVASSGGYGYTVSPSPASRSRWAVSGFQTQTGRVRFLDPARGTLAQRKTPSVLRNGGGLFRVPRSCLRPLLPA